MFIDQVKIMVKAGDGGNGAVAFRREKYVPLGGPAGGDGGRGGNIIFTVDEGMSTLMNFRYKRRYTAKNGEHGMSKGMHGKGALDLVVKLPAGTIVRDAETNEIIADLITENDRVVVAKGGRGGRGNARFATPKNPAPELSENGEPGIVRDLNLELKLLADVGVIGFPSVGKSTLLSIVTAASPKIGAYHFTTITPNIGVVAVDEERSFVMADMPGLIEGAHEGVGLGIKFLRHIERTRVLVHMIDMSGTDGRDPYEDYLTINKELVSYSEDLAAKPQIIVANKMDLPNAEDNLRKFTAKIEANIDIVPLSTVTTSKKGLQSLLFKVADLLIQASKAEEEMTTKLSATNEHGIYTFVPEEPAFTLTRESDSMWRLSGEKIERLFKMTNFVHEESVRKFARQLRKIGVDDELSKRGASHGDIVRILQSEFEWQNE